jgi:signal transduction histidine kinase
MRLGIKTSILLLFVFLFFGKLGTNTIERKFNSALEDIENIQVDFFKTNIEKSIHYLDSNIQAKVKDWTGWDDAFEYIQKRNPAFIKNNIADASLAQLNINHIIFFSETGEKIFEMADQRNSAPIDISNESKKQIWEVTRNSGIKGYSDFIVDQGRLILFAARKVFPTSLKGEGAGLIVMARYLQSDFISDIDQITGLKVKIDPVLGSESVKAIQDLGSVRKNQNSFEGNLVLKNNLNNPVGVLNYSAPRYSEKIQGEFKSGITQLLYGLAILSLFTVIAILWYLLGRPIKKLVIELPDFFNFKSNKGLTWQSQDELGLFVKKLNLLKQEFLEMQVKLDEEKAQLVASNRFRALAEMAGGIAHEINNPLTIVLGCVERLKKRLSKLSSQIDPVSESALLNDIDRVKVSGGRAVEIIRILTELTEGIHHYNLVTHDISVLWEMVVTSLSRKANEYKVEINMSVEGAMPVSCDNLRIRRALRSIIDNAIDAAWLGQTKWIKIIGYSKNMKAIFEIIDSGSGISPENKEKIFNPFFTTKEPGNGVGLGLTVATLIIESHSGIVRHDKTESGQTRFLIELPLVSTANLENQKAA